VKLSRFGQKFTEKSGILGLMDDLGKAMATDEKVYMLGGGNPPYIPAVEAVWRQRMEAIVGSGRTLEEMLGTYDTPQGNQVFIRSLVNLLNREYGWGLTERNIAITNGSQTSFFYLFNLLAGEMPDGSFKKILFPLTPEYIGYTDQGIVPEMFVSHRPEIEMLDAHTFKYHVDFSQIEVGEDIAAICVSRPTNPTGNVLTDEEVEGLAALAREKNIPLIVDNAYGVPFPGIIFTDATPQWDEGRILAMSLSKVGLPSSRNGIIIASEDVIEAMTAVNAITSLATGGIGQRITQPLIESGEILTVANTLVKPFYQTRAQQAVAWIHEFFDDDLPYAVHKCEGALFLWLWLRDLPIASQELYQRLKQRNVIVVPGEYFFPGLEKDDWQHKRECLRLNYAHNPEDVREGLRIIAEEVTRAYKNNES